MGNLPAAAKVSIWRTAHAGARRTLGKTGAKETGDLLDQGLGGQEGVILLGELLDELLVLVEPEGVCLLGTARRAEPILYALLQVINGHVLEVNLLGAIDVGGIGENADGHARAGDMGEPERTFPSVHRTQLE